VRTKVQKATGWVPDRELKSHWEHRALREDRPLTNSDVIISVRDSGVWRVRLSATKFDQGTYMGQQMTSSREMFLDVIVETVNAGTFQRREVMPTPVIPANSRDTMDFGRLDAAMSELMQQMSSIEKPDAEQLQAWVLGYQHCSAWLNGAHARLAAADEVARALALRLASHL
jgi:hypothetical protein